MWPFTKKLNLLGLGMKQTKEGGFTFEITEAEQQEIDKLFDLLEGYAVHPDFADTLKQGLTARGLANYAADQFTIADLSSQKKNREEHIRRAIASISKAYSIYQLPIYLYDMACFLEMAVNGHHEAMNTFKLFLKRQSEYKPGKLDGIIMQDRDIDYATKDAANKLCGATK